MKKKILSLMLAMVMMLSLSVTALAAGNPDSNGNYADESSITITKNLVVERAEGEEDDATVKVPSSATFNFTVSEGSVEKAADGTVAPTIGTLQSDGSYGFSISTTNGTGNYELSLPNVAIPNTNDEENVFTSVGVYTYTITEVEPDEPVAGVTYNSDTYTLKITVVYNEAAEEYVRVVAIINNTTEEKQDTDDPTVSDFDIENTYNAHTLTVVKAVSGSLGDKYKDFTFTVTFTAPNDETWTNEIEVNGAIAVAGKDNTYTFTLADGENHSFNNIPDGVTYTVVEDKTGLSSYTTTGEVTTATAMNGEDVTVTIENENTDTVDTGISLDSLPYILMLIVVAAGVVVMISRRRLDNRF